MTLKNIVKMRSMVKTFVTAAIVLCIISSFTLTSSAASVKYSGRGSKSDPFLVQTAEQLDGIRQNLLAHYKLANTIDLSSYSNFVPIGSVASPFKGSLVCDNGADGKPLYAIKNVKININPAGATLAEKFSGYKEDGSSGWEAGLFGCAQNSKFTNILVLDATVTNKVEGLYSMNSDFSKNPGIDMQAAGILVAIGESLTVEGCGVSGSLTSASNHVGGMLGYIKDTTVTNCYSYATVTSTGSWGSGGLAGSLNGSCSISSSFYSGTFSGGLTHAGAFAGSAYGTGIVIQDCWAAGTVKTSSSGCFLGTKVHGDGNDLKNVDICKNSYTLSKIEGRTKAQTNKTVKNNNYVSDEIGIFEIGFAVASQAEMKTVFASFDAWTVSGGGYPQLKNVHPVTDSSVYKVKAVTTPSEQMTTNDSSAASTVTESAVSDASSDTASDDQNMVSGDSDTTETGGVENVKAEMGTAEIVLIIVLSSLVFLTLAGCTVTMIMIFRQQKPKTSYSIPNEINSDNDISSNSK